MRKVTPLAMGALVLIGCAHAAKVQVASTADPAVAEFTTVEGDPIEPRQCQTPCVVNVPGGSRCRMTVTARGYYPAVFEFSSAEANYTRNAQASKDDQARLFVPMVQRIAAVSPPSAPVAPQAVVEDPRPAKKAAQPPAKRRSAKARRRRANG